jgi:hypothetical protein
MFQVTGKSLGSGFQEPGREPGSLVTMIAGETGWKGIMRTTKPLGITLRKGFGLKGITEIVKN